MVDVVTAGDRVARDYVASGGLTHGRRRWRVRELWRQEGRGHDGGEWDEREEARARRGPPGIWPEHRRGCARTRGPG